MVDVIDKYDQVFREAGDEWNIDPILLKALAKHESGGDPNIRGTSGEIGLGQFMPGTAKQIGITDRSNPEQSIWGMAKLMNEALIAEKENPTAALRYYNGGPGWRSKRTDPNYPSYVGGQYKKYAAADTGSRTDATPAPVSGQTDEEFLDEQAKTYPGLAVKDAAPAAPARGGAVAQTDKNAPTTDSLMERMRKLSGAGSGGSPEAPAKPGTTAAPEPAAPSADDLLKRMGTLAPPEPEPEKKAAAAPDAGVLSHLGTGAIQGVADVVHTANTFADWVNQHVPILAQLDKLTGLDPKAKAAVMEEARKAYEASEAGQSTAGTIGRFGGQAVATAPLLGPVGGAAGAGANLLMRGATGLAPWLLRTAGQGAAVGAGFGAAASGGSDAPLGQQVLEGAETGAMAGPVFDAAGRVILPAARAIGRGIANNRGLLWTPGEPPPPGAPPPPSPLSPMEQRIADVRNRYAGEPNLLQQPPTEGQAAPSPGMGAPSSVGAAGTPRSMAGMTEREIANNRWNAEQKYLLETQEPGVRDTNVYVKGNNPNEAQAEQTVHAARELKAAKNIDTVVGQEAREAADRANINRQTHYADVAKSEFDHTKAVTDRDTALEKNVAEVFANKGQADSQSIVDVGQGILDGPNGKLDPVERVVKNVMGKLYDRAGNLERDPEQLWGVRKQINHLMSKEAALESPTNRAATRELMQMRDAVDAAMERAAPGFKAKVLEPYAQASKAIDAMELLQGRETKLLDTQGRMQFSKVRAMLKEATAARHPDAPVNPWQSLTDEQMTKLRALDTDLRRSASAEDLARAAGSDTVPNLADVAKAYGKMGVHGIPVLGPMVARGQAALAPIQTRRAAARIQQRGLEMLNPPAGKYPPPNPLTPP